MTTAQPAQPSMPDPYAQNVTPGQTTRSGRISRPPVAPPMQDQLALLQQILGTPNGNTAPPANTNAGPSRQTQSAQHYGRPSVPLAPSNASQHSAARTTGVKRPHSALRDTAIPPQPSAPHASQEDAPLVRPVPTSINGRPKKGDVTSKEERLERRRIQNSQSGTYLWPRFARYHQKRSPHSCRLSEKEGAIHSEPGRPTEGQGAGSQGKGRRV